MKKGSRDGGRPSANRRTTSRGCTVAGGGGSTNRESARRSVDLVDIANVNGLERIAVSANTSSEAWLRSKNTRAYPTGTMGIVRVSELAEGSTLLAMAKSLLKAVLMSSKDQVSLK
jgi:hypothetical protein